jgi:hypothetical protein
MSADRFVVLGLAHVRSPWFAQLSQWATAASVPVDFIKCMSLDEVRARLSSGRAFSALVVDAGIVGIDRDLIDQASQIGCSTVLVDDGSLRATWSSLGATAVLPADFDREQFRALLHQHAHAIGTVTSTPQPIEPEQAATAAWRGQLIAVTGAGGTGSSTAAMAIAQGLGRDVRNRSLDALADLALDADQAMLHDARDVVPGVQELVDAFRHATLAPDEVRALTFGDEHPYRVLLGLRRHRDWTALRPRAFHAALDGLRSAFTKVVADIDADLDGEAECGSIDVEERNLMSRTVVAQADVVVVTGLAGPQGLHRLARLLGELREHDVPDTRILPVVNRAPRSARLRSEITRALAELVATRHEPGTTPAPASPVFVTEQRRLDASIRDGLGVPTAVATSLAAAVTALSDRLVDESARAHDSGAPVPIRPGSLGSWATSQEATG